MARPRWLRVVADGVRLGLFVFAAYAASRFFLNTLRAEGWAPGALFGLLLVTGGLALSWRAAVDLRKSIRRLR